MTSLRPLIRSTRRKTRQKYKWQYLEGSDYGGVHQRQEDYDIPLLQEPVPLGVDHAARLAGVPVFSIINSRFLAGVELTLVSIVKLLIATSQ